MINVLLIGGRGQIGSGLRIYFPKLDPGFIVTSVDLPGVVDHASESQVTNESVDLDINTDPAALSALAAGKDMIVYLARMTPRKVDERDVRSTTPRYSTNPLSKAFETVGIR